VRSKLQSIEATALAFFSLEVDPWTREFSDHLVPGPASSLTFFRQCPNAGISPREHIALCSSVIRSSTWPTKCFHQLRYGNL
jgi:hypothetical protein